MCQQTSGAMLLHVREPCRHHLPALQDDAGEHHDAKCEERERAEPENPRQRFERWIVENEISVTCHHVVANLRNPISCHFDEREILDLASRGPRA